MHIDLVSKRKLDKRFKVLGKHYPIETFKAIVKIAFDMKAMAQRKIKADKHIVTSRLRNSIYVKTKGQRYAKRGTNTMAYSFDGGSDNRDLSVPVKTGEAVIGTNVLYAWKIEKLDSYIKYASENVDMRKRIKDISKKVNKKL